MTPSAKENTLGDADVRTNGDLFEVQQPSVDADPYIVSDAQFPRPMNSNVMPYKDIGSDGRTKKPEYRHSQWGRAPDAIAHKCRYHYPKGLEDLWSALVVPGTCETGQTA